MDGAVVEDESDFGRTKRFCVELKLSSRSEQPHGGPTSRDASLKYSMLLFR
jgi:hypothetical protein